MSKRLQFIRVNALKGVITGRCIVVSVAWGLLLAAPAVCGADDDQQAANLYFSHIEAACAAIQGKTIEERCEEIRKALLGLKKCDQIDKVCAPGEALLRRLFGTTYRETLPDYIVYFDQTGGEGRFLAGNPVLMWRNKNTPHLYGVRDIYAIVLTEHKVCLNVHVATDYRSQPNPFSAVFNLLGAKLEPSQTKASESKNARVVWHPLSGNPDNPGMWFAFAAVSVDVNTTNRIIVRYAQPKPSSENKSSSEKKKSSEEIDQADECTVRDTSSPDKKYSGNFLAANGFFSNSPDSFATVSLALGGTFNTRGTSVASGGISQSFNGYALAKFYLVRPELHAGPGSSGHRHSWGIVVGTNVTHTVFDEIVVGGSFGHVIGNVGFVVGVNSIAGVKDSREGRKMRPFLGIDYTF